MSVLAGTKFAMALKGEFEIEGLKVLFSKIIKRHRGLSCSVAELVGTRAMRRLSPEQGVNIMTVLRMSCSMASPCDFVEDPLRPQIMQLFALFLKPASSFYKTIFNRG